MRATASRCAGRAASSSPVDGEGLVVDALPALDYLFVTPSHQSPTTATLEPRAPPSAAAQAPSVARLRRHRGRLRGREPLRRRADAGAEEPRPQRPRDLRRLGVEEPVAGAAARLHRRAARAHRASCALLRHAMVRHPSAFLQHAYALFLSLGHHESHARRVNAGDAGAPRARRRGAARATCPSFEFDAAAGRRLDLGARAGLGRRRRAVAAGARATAC